MNQEKVAYAQQRAREQGARTTATEEKIEQVVAAIASMAAEVDAGADLRHFHGGVINATVFNLGNGPQCRINITTRTNRMLMIQVALS